MVLSPEVVLQVLALVTLYCKDTLTDVLSLPIEKFAILPTPSRYGRRLRRSAHGAKRAETSGRYQKPVARPGRHADLCFLRSNFFLFAAPALPSAF
jgi:hypothetical protein